jgi:adenylate kinase
MNVLFIGAPGSGKGTQSRELIEQFGFLQLSTGDLLRGAIKNKTELGLKAQGFMDAGKLVPDELMIDLVDDYLTQNKGKSIIFDGFPRTVKQAESLGLLLAKNSSQIDKVFYFKINPQILIDRLTGRRTCANCGEIYHIRTKPSSKGDKCEKCGGDLVHRKDDHADVISERLKQFEDNTGPTIEYYFKAGNMVNIDGDQAPEEVFKEIKKTLML